MKSRESKSSEIFENIALRATVALFNIGGILAIGNDARTNPNGVTAKHVADMAMHVYGLAVVFPGLYDKIEAQVLATGGNIARLAQIASRLHSGTSVLPLVANVGDIVNHVVNVGYNSVSAYSLFKGKIDQGDYQKTLEEAYASSADKDSSVSASVTLLKRNSRK